MTCGKWFRRTGLLALLCCAPFSPGSANSEVVPFEYELIGPSGGAFVVDSNGVPHRAYIFESQLYYSIKTSTGWVSQVINLSYTPPYSISRIAIDVDSQNEPHIAFYLDLLNLRGIRYIDDINTPNVTVVDFVAGTASYVNLKMDSDDVPHIAYQANEQGNDRIVYAVKPHGQSGFDTEYVADNGRGTSLDLHNTTPSICSVLNGFAPEGVRYLTKPSGTWVETIIDTELIPDYLDLAMDVNGKAHISYSVTWTGLVYATNSSGIWTKDVLNAADFIHGTSIDTDAQALRHIAFMSQSDGTVRYTGATANHIVDSSGDAYWPVALDVDVFGDILIAYSTPSSVIFAYSHDCNDNEISDSVDIANGTSLDCNSNGVPDDCDIAQGRSQDCNGNGIPDDCDTFNDCNNNGINDICDVTSGFSADCNNNLMPDECEPDCDSDGVPDWCEVVYEGAEDCNDNYKPDECETLLDCNGNGIVDQCEIDAGTLPDCNANGIPDSCDVANGAVDCDMNGIQDLCDFGTHLVISGPGGAYDEFGTSLARGDINGDGLEDLIVGGPYSGASTYEGRVYVYYGGTPMDGTADLVLAGSTSGASLYFGYDVACGDVNNDGYDDVVVGAPIGSTWFNSNRGFVYVFLGGPTPLTTYDTVLYGSAYEQLGYAVACADINGDNYDDVIAGTNPTGSFPPAEKVEIYLGNALGSGPYQTFLGESGGDQYGTAVANAGDIDGNGVEDLIVGAPTNNYNAGKAYLYLGQLGGTMAAGPTYTGSSWYFGGVVSGGADVNVDGFDDVLITGYNSKNLFVFFGATTPDNTVDVFIEHVTNSSSADNWHSLSSAADVNGDGIQDIILGTPSDKGRDRFAGTTRIFYGGASIGPDTARVLKGEDDFGHLGGAVLGFADMNGDGMDEFVIGEPGYGSHNQGRIHVLDILHAQTCPQIGVPQTFETLFGLRAHPSPFSSSTNLVFSLPEPGDVSLQVFDAAGRLVSELARAPYPAGTSSVVWNGKSRSRPLPNGVYFARLSFGGKTTSAKIVLLR